MTSPDRPASRRIEVTLPVTSDAEVRELNEAWRQIISGKQLPRTEALDYGVDAVMERARVALATLENALREHPTTGQAARLVRFLAGLYNGSEYPFDLTELRGLDTELANACLDYLNYDRLGKREVHQHLSGGDRELHRWLKDDRIEPALGLADVQREALAQHEEQTGHGRDDLLREAIELLHDKYARKAPG